MEQSGDSTETPIDSGVQPEIGDVSLRDAIKKNWQIPTLGVGGALLVAGIVATIATKPGPDLNGTMQVIDRQIDREQYIEAIDLLNNGIFPYLDTSDMTPSIRREYHLQLARALHGGQTRLEVPQRANDENTIKQYLEAERRDAVLTPSDIESLAEAYLALDMVEQAHNRVRQVPSVDRARRDRLYRKLVNHELDRQIPGLDRAMGYLQEQLDDPGLPAVERSWVLAREAEIQVDMGFADDAINLLLRQMPILLSEGAPGLGDLYLQLGRAYLAVDAVPDAERELARADDSRLIPDSSDERALVRLLRAEVDFRQGHEEGRLASARDRYQEVVDRDGSTPAYRPALLGLAEVCAALDDLPASYEAYEALTLEAKANPGERDPSSAEVQRSLLKEYERQAASGNVYDALRYATLAGDLSTLSTMPPEALLALAMAHRAVAADILGVVGDDPVAFLMGDDIDPATQQDAKRHLIRSAGYFNAHAERLVLDNYDAYLDSLWNAANLYNRAGDKDEAVRTFSDFAQNAQGDARRPEARFRIGQIHQSRGEYMLAADQYQGLIDERRGGGTPEVGIWADASYVPLAQCYILDADPANDAEAEQMLANVLDGTLGGPGRPEFRDALVELGRLNYKRDAFGPAQERFTELLERFPEDPRATEVRFRLADTRLKIAEVLRDKLNQPIRDSEARELRAAREDHLAAALALFEQVRDELNAKPLAKRSQLEEMFLRNSYFYMGDCAYDLGDYRAAIAHYGSARKRYPQDPSVLVAMTQIVSAYLKMGDLTSAQAAQERAKSFYTTLPPEVWNDPNLPMSRQDWERWLDSSAQLYEARATEN